MASFNSIKVRLIHLTLFLCDSYHVFQFHKGAINTAGRLVAQGALRQFQFHKGAINTLNSTSDDALAIVSIP